MFIIKAVGIDLAKLVFSIYEINEHDKPKYLKTVKQNNLLAKIAKLPPCIIGMEACSGAHYWAREFTKLLMMSVSWRLNLLSLYRQIEKNDANDAEAICEAVTRPKTRFVSIKSEEQQAVLCLHRFRQGAIKDRTARINRL
ncbi:transposase [Colwelliaceae bacterium 6471]